MSVQLLKNKYEVKWKTGENMNSHTHIAKKLESDFQKVT